MCVISACAIFCLCSEMASNDIIDDLHKGEKLDGDNYRQKNI